MMSNLHDTELLAIQWISQFRSPAGDAFFRFMNFFDRPEFYILLFPLIWYGFSRTWGIRLFFWLMLSAICNFYLKNTFGLPRPYELNAALGLLTVNGYGFPSGAAQSSLFLVGAFIKAKRSAFAWFSGLGYLVIICFSRVYLGVHFPTDIIGGLTFGLLLLLIFFKFSNRLEKWLSKQSLFMQFSLVIAFVSLAYLPSQAQFIGQQCAAIIGVSTGLILAAYFKVPKVAASPPNGIFALLSVIAIALLAKKYFLLDPVIMNCLLGLWLSLGLPYLLSMQKHQPVLRND